MSLERRELAALYGRAVANQVAYYDLGYQDMVDADRDQIRSEVTAQAENPIRDFKCAVWDGNYFLAEISRHETMSAPAFTPPGEPTRIFNLPWRDPGRLIVDVEPGCTRPRSHFSEVNHQLATIWHAIWDET